MLQKRRRSLLTLASYGTWDFDLASFPYVYNSLLPNGSEVVKGKIAKIYANGVIKNQIIENGNFATTGNWYASVLSTLSISGNVATLTAGSISYDNDVALNNGSIVAGIIGHKYLLKCYVKCSKAVSVRVYYSGQWQNYYSGFSISANTWTFMPVFFQPSSSNQLLIISPIEDTKLSSGDTFDIKEVNLIDLTQRYGPGNEPTTLTDNRIQNLLNRGYIAYNTGEYKGTNVWEIATEPYNLADNVFTLGWWSGNVGSQIGISNYRFDMKLAPISVLPSTSYTLEFDNVSGANINGYIIETNENGIVLVRNQYITSGTSITFTSNTHYAYIYFYDRSEQVEIGNTLPNINACFYRTGTRTGYAKHKPSASIPFIYQGNGALNAHDTFEITSSEYVFTKNIGSVDLGSLNYGSSQAYGYYSSSLSSIAKRPSSNNIIPNIVCSKFTTNKRNDSGFSSFGNNLITFDVDGDLDISYTQGLTISQFVSEVAGISLHYELATPQVIRIPRKHLGIVDLGSLSWTYNPNGFFISAYALANIGGKLPASGSVQANFYCSPFITATFNDTYSSKDMSIGANDVGSLIIRNNGFGTDPDQFKQAMSGIYLFYETAEEVDDIATRIFTENGGTVTTDSDVLPNLDLDLPVKV